MKFYVRYITAISFFITSVVSPIGAVAQTGSMPQGYKQISKSFPIRFSDMQSTYKGVHRVLQSALDKSMYKNCVSTGDIADNRIADKKYFCPEWPLGTTSPVIDPQDGRTISPDASQIQVSLNSTKRSYEQLVSTNAPEATLNQQRRLLAMFERSLASWKSNKVIFEDAISLYDMANNEREFVFQLKGARFHQPGKVRTQNLFGGATEQEREVANFLGKQSVKTYVVSGNLYQEICFTHPQVTIGGQTDPRREGLPVNRTDFTIQKGIIRDTVTLSFNPGVMTASSVEYCALVRITAATPNPGKIELVAVDSPKFVDAQIAGLEANVTGISFWTSLVVFLLGSIAALVGFFKTGDFKLLLLSPILLLGAGLQAVLPFGIFNVLQFVANKMIDKAMNNVAREGEGYLRDGTYIKDIAVAGTTTVGANAVANAVENLKKERTMTAHMDPKAALSAQCLSLGKMATKDQQILGVIRNQCYSFAIALKEDEESVAAGCYERPYLVQAESAQESLRNCRIKLEVSAVVPTVFDEVLDCIGNSQFNQTESISQCLPLMSHYIIEMRNKVDAARVGVEESDMSLSSSAQAITLMRNNLSTFNEIEKYLKALRGAEYEAKEAVEYLKQLVEKQTSMQALKERLFKESGIGQQLEEVYNKYFRRASLPTEKSSFAGLLANNNFTQAVNILINRARSEFSYALYGISVEVTGTGATFTEVAKWFNTFISGTMSKEALLESFRNELAYSQRTRSLISMAYKQKKGVEIAVTELEYHLGRLARGEVKMARLKKELGI